MLHSLVVVDCNYGGYQTKRLIAVRFPPFHKLLWQSSHPNWFEGYNGRVRGVCGAGAIKPLYWGVDSASATYAPHTIVGALKLHSNRTYSKIHTMQFWTGTPSKNMFNAIIDQICIGIPKWCMVGSITTCSSNHKHLSSNIIASIAGLRAILSWKNIDIWCLHSSCCSR